MQVRTLVIAVSVLAGIGLVWWVLAWESGMQPLGPGSGGTNPAGLTVVAKTPTALGGTNLYAWKPGGRFVVTLDFHNSASVPVTITGGRQHPQRRLVRSDLGSDPPKRLRRQP